MVTSYDPFTVFLRQEKNVDGHLNIKTVILLLFLLPVQVRFFFLPRQTDKSVSKIRSIFLSELL